MRAGSSTPVTTRWKMRAVIPLAASPGPLGPSPFTDGTSPLPLGGGHRSSIPEKAGLRARHSAAAGGTRGPLRQRADVMDDGPAFLLAQEVEGHHLCAFHAFGNGPHEI